MNLKSVSYTHLDVYKRQVQKKSTYIHTFWKMTFLRVLTVVQSESTLILNTILFCDHHLPFSYRTWKSKLVLLT